MTILEWLVLIFIFIEAGQLYKLIQVNKKQVSIWEKILEDPIYAGEVLENFVFGFMDRVNTDTEAQEQFFGFVGTCGVNAAAAIRHYFTGNPDALMPEGDLKGVPKGLKGIIKACNALGIPVKDIVVNAVNKQAKQMVDSWGNPIS